MLWHSGSGNGQIAYMAIFPRDNFGVVVLINSWRAPILHGTLASRIVDTYLNLPARDWSAEALRSDSAAQVRAAEAMRKFQAGQVANTRPSRPLEQYAGVYADSVYGNIAVKFDNGRLTLQMGRGEIADLRHWHYDIFLVEWRTPLFREQFTTRASFTLDADGRPSALTMRLNRDTVTVRRVGG
jgi:hypothetical protein